MWTWKYCAPLNKKKIVCKQIGKFYPLFVPLSNPFSSIATITNNKFEVWCNLSHENFHIH